VASNKSGALTALGLVVLELLHEHPRHPYDMQQTVCQRNLDRFVKIRAGSLYHTVERLQKIGLIEPLETARAGRRPERTVYAITAEGREEFHSALTRILRHPETEYPVFGTAIEMLRTLEPTATLALLEHRIVELRTSIAALRTCHQSLITGLKLSRIKIIELEYALAMQEAECAWVQRLVADIRSGELTWTPVDQDQSARPTKPLSRAAAREDDQP
jgi:DNA-binding PadR family transcriptional regulator